MGPVHFGQLARSLLVEAGQLQRALNRGSRQKGFTIDAAADAIEVRDELEARTAWIDLNGRFHGALVEAAGNEALALAIAQVSRVPLASPRAIVFDTTLADHGLSQVTSAQEDHERVVDALLRRQGARAAAIMREHAYRSSRNKRTNVEAIHSGRLTVSLPGASLIGTAG